MGGLDSFLSPSEKEELNCQDVPSSEIGKYRPIPARGNFWKKRDKWYPGGSRERGEDLPPRFSIYSGAKLTYGYLVCEKVLI